MNRLTLRRGLGLRHYSYYPPPEPFNSPSARPPPTNISSSNNTSDSPAPISSLSTFGATPNLLSRYLRIAPTQLTLSSIVALGGGKPGVPPSDKQLLNSARFTAKELPVRLARRVDQFRSLPFIVGSNPYISKIAKLYASSFDSLASIIPIKTLSENDKFVEKLDEMVNSHSENIPTLARGFLECKKYMSSNAISMFLDGAIHSRIGIRLIAEQHLALSYAHKTGQTSNPNSVGIIDTKVNAYDLIQTCADFVGDLCESTLGVQPELHIEGDRDATFVGVASHLSYCMTELLKNSYRATVERHAKKQDSFSMRKSGDTAHIPPVLVSIALSPKMLSIRIRDQGGGISPKDLPHIFEYTFTTAKSGSNQEPTDDGPYSIQNSGGTDLGALTGNGSSGLLSANGMVMSGLGYGIPLTRIYVQRGRGTLSIVSMYSFGTDTYLQIRANPLTD
jgi:hypothetical protein